MPLLFVLQVFTVSSNLSSNSSRYLLPSGDLQGSAKTRRSSAKRIAFHLLLSNSTSWQFTDIKSLIYKENTNGLREKLYSYSISCHYLTSSFMIRLTCSLPILKLCTSCILLEYQISVRGYASASPKRDRNVSAFLWIYNPSLA